MFSSVKHFHSKEKSTGFIYSMPNKHCLCLMSSFVEIFNYYLSYFSSLITIVWLLYGLRELSTLQLQKKLMQTVKTQANKESDFINQTTHAEHLGNETGKQKKTMDVFAEDGRMLNKSWTCFATVQLLSELSNSVQLTVCEWFMIFFLKWPSYRHRYPYVAVH